MPIRRVNTWVSGAPPCQECKSVYGPPLQRPAFVGPDQDRWSKECCLAAADRRIPRLVKRIAPGGPSGHGLLLEQQGIAVKPVTNDGCKRCFAGWISHTEAPDDLLRRMCAMFLVLGYLLAWDERGPRVAARWLIEVCVTCRLRCVAIMFPFFAIGATENLLMATSQAKGRLS
jgi:hypothetical protein